METIWK
jgi:hypothetical protein